MKYFDPSAADAISRALQQAVRLRTESVSPIHLVRALAESDKPELAALWRTCHTTGEEVAATLERLAVFLPNPKAPEGLEPQLAAWTKHVLERAYQMSAPGEVSAAHLMLAMFSNSLVARILALHGLQVGLFRQSMARALGRTVPPTWDYVSSPS